MQEMCFNATSTDNWNVVFFQYQLTHIAQILICFIS